ncbi:MAG: HAMP domain-containing sensor histidine kinase [Anaerolineae bacterium]
MELLFSLDWPIPYLVVPRDPAGLALSLLLALLLALAAFRGYHRDRRALMPWLVGLAAATGGSVLAGSVWLEATVPALRWVLGPRVPVLGLVPAVLAAWFGGVLPAGLAAAAAGIATAGQTDHSLTSVLAASLAGLVLAHLLRQDFTGRTFALLRRPALATLVASLLWPVPFWRFLAAPALWAPPGAWTWLLLALLGPALAAGVLGEALALLAPSGRPVQKPARVGPHQRFLAGRLMAAFVPALLSVALVGAFVANLTAARAVARQAEAALPSTAHALRNEMEWTRRAAESALSQMAAQVSATPDRLPTAATLDARGLFSALWVLDSTGEVVSAQPDPSAPLDLALLLRLAQDPNGWVWAPAGELLVQAPLLDGEGKARGYLVGAIPARERIAALLAEVGSPFPTGLYFLQPQGVPLAQAWFFEFQGSPVPSPEALQRAEAVGETGGRMARFSTSAGYVGFATPVEGCGVSLGLLLPVQTLAASALRVLWPLLAALALSATGAAAACSGLTASALHPLERLVQVAGRIARGHWSTQVQIASPDEVGRLALAIEEMRRTLQARGQQIALLADLAEGSLEHDQVQVHLVRLLRGLLRSSEANASAVVIWGGHPEASSLVREQEAGAAVPSDPWIKGLAEDLALQRAPLFHERLLQAPLVDRFAEPLALGVQAVAALPLTLNGTYLGMLYVQYPTSQNFSQMDRGLLLALARQAALLLGYAEARTRWGQAEQELHALLEASYDPALVLSGEGRVLAANRAAERAFAFDLARWRGKPVTPALAGEDLARLVGRILTAQAPLSSEGTVRGQRTFAFQAMPFGTDGGRPAGWVLVARDMSDLKALDALKRDFITAFTHDLKAPVQRVRSLLTVIPMFSELTAKQKELLQTCTEQLDSLSALIGGIVELAQVEGAQDLHLAPCQLAAILSQVAEEHRAVAKGKHIRVHLEIGAQPPLLLADEGLVRLALRHLLDNAIRFTPSGGQVVLGLTTESEQVTLYVQDTGVGIPPDEQPRVFERFYRGREAVVAGIPGNGLGLAVVRAVAEAHGGRAWVESVPGEGSTFYLALPRAGRKVGPGEPVPERVKPIHESGNE